MPHTGKKINTLSKPWLITEETKGKQYQDSEILFEDNFKSEILEMNMNLFFEDIFQQRENNINNKTSRITNEDEIDIADNNQLIEENNKIDKIDKIQISKDNDIETNKLQSTVSNCSNLKVISELDILTQEYKKKIKQINGIDENLVNTMENIVDNYENELNQLIQNIKLKKIKQNFLSNEEIDNKEDNEENNKVITKYNKNDNNNNKTKQNKSKTNIDNSSDETSEDSTDEEIQQVKKKALIETKKEQQNCKKQQIEITRIEKAKEKTSKEANEICIKSPKLKVEKERFINIYPLKSKFNNRQERINERKPVTRELLRVMKSMDEQFLNLIKQTYYDSQRLKTTSFSSPSNSYLNSLPDPNYSAITTNRVIIFDKYHQIDQNFKEQLLYQAGKLIDLNERTDVILSPPRCLSPSGFN
ncbi:hypothetical protein K502DRAFT_344237 [Neoconidiobolus thromboides FSU 785]|nr:hypothetical protein K502DRAFT_344237 [Neoconidiobolus thromboides FSU 785]